MIQVFSIQPQRKNKETVFRKFRKHLEKNGYANIRDKKKNEFFRFLPNYKDGKKRIHLVVKNYNNGRIFVEMHVDDGIHQVAKTIDDMIKRLIKSIEIFLFCDMRYLIDPEKNFCLTRTK